MKCLELNWIFTIRVEYCNEYCNFLNLYGRYVLWYESFLTIFSLYTQQIEEILGAITIDHFWPWAICPGFQRRWISFLRNSARLRAMRGTELQWENLLYAPFHFSRVLPLIQILKFKVSNQFLKDICLCKHHWRLSFLWTYILYIYE